MVNQDVDKDVDNPLVSGTPERDTGGDERGVKVKTIRARRQVGWQGATYTQAFRGRWETVVCPRCTAHLNVRELTDHTVIGAHILTECYMCADKLYFVAH